MPKLLFLFSHVHYSEEAHLIVHDERIDLKNRRFLLYELKKEGFWEHSTSLFRWQCTVIFNVGDQSRKIELSFPKELHIFICIIRNSTDIESSTGLSHAFQQYFTEVFCQKSIQQAERFMDSLFHRERNCASVLMQVSSCKVSAPLKFLNVFKSEFATHSLSDAFNAPNFALFRKIVLFSPKYKILARWRSIQKVLRHHIVQDFSSLMNSAGCSKFIKRVPLDHLNDICTILDLPQFVRLFLGLKIATISAGSSIQLERIVAMDCLDSYEEMSYDENLAILTSMIDSYDRLPEKGFKTAIRSFNLAGSFSVATLAVVLAVHHQYAYDLDLRLSSLVDFSKVLMMHNFLNSYSVTSLSNVKTTFSSIVNKCCLVWIPKIGPAHAWNTFNQILPVQVIIENAIKAVNKSRLVDIVDGLQNLSEEDKLFMNKNVVEVSNSIVRLSNRMIERRDQRLFLRNIQVEKLEEKFEEFNFIHFCDVEYFCQLLKKNDWILKVDQGIIDWDRLLSQQSSNQELFALSYIENWLAIELPVIARFLQSLSTSRAYLGFHHEFQHSSLEIDLALIGTFLRIYDYCIHKSKVDISSAKVVDFKLISLLQNHCLWASRISASFAKANPLDYLSNDLRNANIAIPITYIRFLSTKRQIEATSDHPNFAEWYGECLRMGKPETDFELFLPPKDVDQQSKAAEKFRDWLKRTVSHAESVETKANFNRLKKRLDSALVQTFPEWYVPADANDADAMNFQMAVNIFRDDLANSELFNSCARKLLSSTSAGQGSFEAIYKAREEATKVLEGTIRGEKYHKHVKSRSSSQVHKRNEINALSCLLTHYCDSEDVRKDLLSVYYDFVHSDPAVILTYSKNLCFFFKDVLKSSVPHLLQDFISMYETIELRDLTMLGKICKLDNDITKAIKNPPKESFCHMLHLFRDVILEETPERCWPQIELLSQLEAILSFLRGNFPTRESLERKLKDLRVMIIANRNMARAVALLDTLSHTVYEMCNAKQADSALKAVCKILKSQILVNVAEANLSMDQLVQLFHRVDSPELIARQNFAILQQSKFVIDMEKLAAFANEPFDEARAGSVVFLETGDRDSAFRLLGGRVWTKIVGNHMFALFAEVIVQINSEKELNGSREDAELDKMILSIEEMQTRAQEVLKLANIFIEYFKLGWSDRSSGNVDFQCTQPEQFKLCALKIMRERNPEDEISAKNFVSNEYRNLKDIYQRIRERFPWTSFCFRRDIMTMKDTPWVKLVKGIASRYPDSLCHMQPSSNQIESNLVHWLTSKSEVANNNSPLELTTGLEGALLERIRSGSRIWLASCLPDDMMSLTLTVLKLLTVHYPLQTSLLPCDASVTVESMRGLTWRIEKASELIENDAEYFEVARLLLCEGGIVVYRPDTLKHFIQDLLISALFKYMTSCSRSMKIYPVICLILPESSSRFHTLVRSMMETRSLNSLEMISWGDDPTNRISCANIRSVVVVPTLNSATGIRPENHLIPSEAFRVQLSLEMTIQDLLQSIRQRSDEDKPLSLDFGSNFASLANGSLSGAIISYFLWGVIGQMHLMPVVLYRNTHLYAELVCDDASMLKKRFPILKLVSPQRISIVAPSAIAPDYGQVCPGFRELVAKPNDNRISDQDVINAIRTLFQVNIHANAKNKRGMPFVYTPLALRTMSKVALHIKQTFLGEAKGTFPVLLSGDTGTGKTYLLYKFLELLMDSGVLEHLSDKVLFFTLSARFKTRELEGLGMEIKKEAFNKNAGRAKKRVVPMVILDDVTSSPAQEAIKRLLANREIKNGESGLTRIKPNDLILLATCNPDPVQDDVFPLSAEMREVKVDVENLDSNLRRRFIEERLNDKDYGLMIANKETVKKAVLLIETASFSNEQRSSLIGCVSLRDAVRCISLAKKALYHWPNTDEGSIFEKLSIADLAVEKELKALGLSCYICFGIRTIPRANFFKRVRTIVGIDLQPFIHSFQDAILNELAMPANVVKTEALKENLTVSVICLALRHPLLLLGCDGTSKTLSLSMAISQMQGKFSKSTFLQGIARMQSFNIQLSEATSASHIAKIKNTVLEWKSKLSVPCIFMEELSMAKAGSTGPLRALHDLLDAHQNMAGALSRHEVGSGSNAFAYVATSNYRPGTKEIPIGRALANRMIILAHPDPSKADLKSLAVKVGMNEIKVQTPDETSKNHERVEEMIGEAVERLSRLVPRTVSVRSLLSFARCLGKQLSMGNDEFQSCLLGATCHLQKINPEETKKVLRAAVGSKAPLEIPGVTARLESLLGLHGAKRPILFLYQSVGDIYSIVRHVREATKAVMDKLKDDGVQKVTSICPCSSRKLSEEIQSQEMENLSPERLYALLNLKSSIEAGSTTFILNPEPMLQGMHALLNDFDQSYSTIQINECNENLCINPSAQIVLLVHWESALSFHNALLSRTAVMNLEMFAQSRLRAWENPYSKLLDHYSNQRSLLCSEHLQREIELLEELEAPLDSFIHSILSGEGRYHQQTKGKLTFVFVENILPSFVYRNKNVIAVDAARYDTQHSLLQAIQNGVSSLSSDLNSHVCLMVDLSSSDSKNAIETLGLLGFAGVTFRVSAKPSSSSEFMKLTTKQDKRVVIILNACLSQSFSCGKSLAWKGDKAPKLKDILKYYFIRNISLPYPDWPLVSEIANNPSSLFDKFVATVHDRILEVYAIAKVPKKAESVFELCKIFSVNIVGEEDLKNVLFCPYEDLLHLAEPRSPEEVQEIRRQTFGKIAQEVRRASSARSLRSSLIERCIPLSEVVAAKIVCKVAKSCLSPDPQRLAYIQAVLSARSFKWQRDSVRSNLGARPHLTVVNQFAPPMSPSKQFLPFVADMVGVVLKGSLGSVESALRVQDIEERIRLSFPSLQDLQLEGLFPDFIREVVLYVAKKYNITSEGVQDSLSYRWLTAASGNNIAKVLWSLMQFESWIAAGILFSYPLSSSNASHWHLDNNTQDCFLIVESFVKSILDVMKSSYQKEDQKLIKFHPIFPRLLKFAIDSVLKSETGCRNNASLSSAYSVTLFWQLKLMTPQYSVSKAFHESYGAIFDQKLDHFLNGLQPNAKSLLAGVVLRCHEVKPLSAESISRFTNEIGMELGGPSFLASCATMKNSNVQVFIDYLESSFRRSKVTNMSDAALRIETRVVARGLRNFFQATDWNFETVFYFVIENQQAKTAHWIAMYLALNAILIPILVQNENFLRKIMGDEPCTSSLPWKKLFNPSYSLPVKNFLIRCLVSRFDERGMHRLKNLPAAVGDWAKPYVKKQLSEGFQELTVLPQFLQHFQQAETDTPWLYALTMSCCSAKRTSVESLTSQQTAMLDDLKTSLDADVEFCSAAAALWCAILAVMHHETVLASPSFVKEQELSSLCLPAAPDGNLEMLQKYKDIIEVRSINRCPCGYVYGIGNCGQPDGLGRCPECKQTLGGSDHDWANGVSHTLNSIADDTVRGIETSWCLIGSSYTERSLQPMEYRLLSVLLLIPLAIWSPRRKERKEQLAKHWAELKRACGLNSDTDTQLYVIGVMKRAMMMNCCDFALSGHAFRDASDRNSFENAFSRTFQRVMGRESCQKVIAEVSALIESSMEEQSPFLELRDSAILAMDPAEASKRFAPQVLQVATGRWEEADDKLESIRRTVTGQPESFPVLARCLFDHNSPSISPEHVRAVDLELNRKLKSLPSLARGLWKVGAAAAALPAPPLTDNALEFVKSALRDSNELREFKEAWEVCRFGHRIECQSVSDVGDLSELQVRDLLWVAETSEEVGMSRTELLLQTLTDAHNQQVALLAPQASRGDEPGRSFDVSLSSWKDVERLETHLIPWEEARASIEKFCRECHTAIFDANSLESIAHDWISQRLSLLFLRLDGWPRVHVQDEGSRRLAVSSQVRLLPGLVHRQIQSWVKEYGLRRDVVVSSVRFLGRMASLSESSSTSGESLLVLENLRSLNIESNVPALLKNILETAAEAKLGFKHLQALQEALLDLLDFRQEESLGVEYRQTYEGADVKEIVKGLPGDVIKYALDKSVALCEQVSRNRYSPEDLLRDYLPYAPLAYEEGNDMDMEKDFSFIFEQPVQLRHLHVLTSSLREVENERCREGRQE